jgi:hypothetical protein
MNTSWFSFLVWFIEVPVFVLYEHLVTQFFTVLVIVLFLVSFFWIIDKGSVTSIGINKVLGFDSRSEFHNTLNFFFTVFFSTKDVEGIIDVEYDEVSGGGKESKEFVGPRLDLVKLFSISDGFLWVFRGIWTI